MIALASESVNDEQHRKNGIIPFTEWVQMQTPSASGRLSEIVAPKKLFDLMGTHVDFWEPDFF